MMYMEIIVFFWDTYKQPDLICEEKMELYAKPDGLYGNS
jgi:hypothetical protein